MLDREVVKEFLEDKLEEIEIPKDISMEALVETFCRYVEDDYYEWLKENYQSFFQPLPEKGIDWDWIKMKIQH